MTKQFDVKLNTQREQVDFARVCNKYSFDDSLAGSSGRVAFFGYLIIHIPS